MLGASLTDVVGAIQKAQPYLDIVVSVVEDPGLPAVASRIRTIRSLAQAQAPKPPPGQVAPKVGIGLSSLVKPLDRYIDVRKHPTKYKLLAVGAVALPLVLGLVLGRVSKRCRVPNVSRSGRAASMSASGARKTALAGGPVRRRTRRTSSRR